MPARPSCLVRLSARFFSSIPHDFVYHRNLLDRHEQRLLTEAALAHLDNVGPSATRRKQKRLLAAGSVARDEHGFLPESCYEFEQGHFDGVIRSYREARINRNQWPSTAQMDSILDKIHQLLPQTPLQTHVLHLAAQGEILPHIDNVDASGSIILGISLGSPRVLRLENESGDVYEHLLEPGSCYIQRDSVRYDYKHSIIKSGFYNGTRLPDGQRLSIMMRDMPVKK